MLNGHQRVQISKTHLQLAWGNYLYKKIEAARKFMKKNHVLMCLILKLFLLFHVLQTLHCLKITVNVFHVKKNHCQSLHMNLSMIQDFLQYFFVRFIPLSVFRHVVTKTHFFILLKYIVYTMFGSKMHSIRMNK